MSSDFPATLKECLNGAESMSAARALATLDLLVRALTAVAVEDLRRSPALRERIPDAAGCLALPFTPSLLELLEAYADDLAENERPSGGARRAFLDLVLIGSFDSPSARGLLNSGSDDGFVASTHGVSLVGLLRAAHPVLSGSRPPPASIAARGVAGIGRDLVNVVRERLGVLGAARFTVVRGARSVESRTRVTLAPPGGSLSQATSATVDWSAPVTEGELALAGAPLEAPVRLAPWIRFEDPAMALLTASPRSPSLRYTPVHASDVDWGTPGDAVEAGLVPWASREEIRTMRSAALRRISDQVVAMGASVVSELSEADVTEGAVLDDRYALKREISRGGSGAVFEATELSTSEPAVVKVLASRGAQSPTDRDHAREAFAREAQILGAVRHAGIPQLLHDGSRSYPPFIAIEALSPRTLRDLLTPPRPLEPERAAAIMLQLAGAVAALHGAGIVHRDVKPENVLVDDREHVHLVDFGLARLRASEGVIVDDVGGTIPYVAPEALDGGRIGPATDVFALGCVLYECLTGRPLFAATTRREAAQKIRKGQRAPSSAIAGTGRDAFYDVVHAATENDPGRRLRDADLFVGFLEKAARGERPTPHRKEAGFIARLFGGA